MQWKKYPSSSPTFIAKKLRVTWKCFFFFSFTLRTFSFAVVNNVPKTTYNHCKCDNNICHLPMLFLRIEYRRDELILDRLCFPRRQCIRMEAFKEYSIWLPIYFFFYNQDATKYSFWRNQLWCYIANKTDYSVSFADSICFEDRAYSYTGNGETD